MEVKEDGIEAATLEFDARVLERVSERGIDKVAELDGPEACEGSLVFDDE
jgi:hypothetical protein